MLFRSPLASDGLPSLLAMEVGKTRTPSACGKHSCADPEDDSTWGEERIANELKFKLGISVSPRTIRKYIGPQTPHLHTSESLRWSTFVRNHSKTVVACDFSQSVTSTFRVAYIFVVAFCIPMSPSIRLPSGPSSSSASSCLAITSIVF